MKDTWWIKASQLDDTQKNVIDLSFKKSHLLIGPPGSGKTNLLLLKASQMVRSGKPNLLVLVFTRTLREFVAAGGSNYAFAPEHVTTSINWSARFLNENGVKPFYGDNFEELRAKRTEQLEQLVAAKKISGYYDAIILDEAQDYSTKELDIFFKLGSVVFAAADKRQRIYGQGDDDIEARFGDQVFPLKYHYRNGVKICRVADSLAKSWTGFHKLEPTCNYDEKSAPSAVQIQQAKDLDEQVKHAAVALKLQMKAYPDELLGVLCYRRDTLKLVVDLLNTHGVGSHVVVQSIDDGYLPFEAGKDICACTIHSSKGLEFRAVHLMNVEEINKGGLIRNVCYTGITRAKTSLTIHHTKPLAGFLQSAFSAINPPPPPAKLDDLFGTKS